MQLHKIPTTQNGKPNGWIMPIFRDYDDFFSNYKIKFVYATSILPHSYKGPHLHKKRQCMLVPVTGVVIVIKLIDGKYVETKLDADNPTICHIPTNVGFRVFNDEYVTAILLNLADHAWTPEDQDSCEVKDWSDGHEIS